MDPVLSLLDLCGILRCSRTAQCSWIRASENSLQLHPLSRGGTRTCPCFTHGGRWPDPAAVSAVRGPAQRGSTKLPLPSSVAQLQ